MEGVEWESFRIAVKANTIIQFNNHVLHSEDKAQYCLQLALKEDPEVLRIAVHTRALMRLSASKGTKTNKC